MRVRLFGREPAAWIGLIEASLALTVALGWVNITRVQTALVMAAVVTGFGVLSAWLTKDTMLGVVVGFTKAVIALAIGFGAHFTPEVTASIIAFVTVILGFFQRTQTSPAVSPGFGSPAPPHTE